MNLYGSDLFGFPREWFSEERDDADVLAPPRFWIVAPRSFLLPDDEDDDFDDDVDPLNREHHREGEEKEATKTRILFSHKHTHTHTPLSHTHTSKSAARDSITLARSRNCPGASGCRSSEWSLVSATASSALRISAICVALKFAVFRVYREGLGCRV